MSHARHLVAAATLTKAEVFCQCTVCLTQAALQTKGPLRKVQYKCGISYINEVEDVVLVHSLHFQLQVLRALHAPMQVPCKYWPNSTFHVLSAGVKHFKCFIIPHGGRVIPCRTKCHSQRTQHMMKIHSIEFCAVPGMVRFTLTAVPVHCVDDMIGSATRKRPKWVDTVFFVNGISKIPIPTASI